MTYKPLFSIPSKPLSRRTVLRGAGGVAISLPLLLAMAPQNGEGRDDAQALRRLLQRQRHDQRPVAADRDGHWVHPVAHPGAAGDASKRSPDFARPQQRGVLHLRRNAHDASSATMLTADRLMVGPSGTGRAGHVLDGTCHGPSIDQEIARVIGGATRLPSLELGVQSTTTILEPIPTRISYRGTPGNAKSVPLEDDPKKVFARLFTEAGTSTSALDTLKKNRKSVLDFVLRDFQRLGATVGVEDKAKLDRHLTTVREFELSLDKLGTTHQ